tara:strand:+ start:2247 stop:3026 length:780 start_codon:yes stop_codon:yes gene_type:complete
MEPETTTTSPWSTAAIAGGSGIIGSIIGNAGARKRQKQADKANIKFWEMQNAYNDPAQQMARLTKAGLNPNLIYGQSVGGATGQAGQVAPSKAAPYSMDIGSSVKTGMAAYQTQAQVNNIDVDTQDKMLQLGVNKEFLREQAEQTLQKQRLGNAKTLIENNVAAGTQQDRILLAAENLSIAKSVLQGQNLKNAEIRFNVEMQDMNISGNSWMSTLLRLILGTAKDKLPTYNPNPGQSKDQGKHNKSGYIINRKKYPDQN